LKTPLILLLAALAVYQTAQLWFVHLTNRNLAVFFAAMFESPVPDGYMELTRPMRVVTNDANQNRVVRYDVTCAISEAAFDMALRQGVFTGVAQREYVWENLQDKTFVMYEYAVFMRAEIFTLAFGPRNNTRLADNGIDRFNAVATTTNGVVFLGETYAWSFSLPEVIQMPAMPHALPPPDFVQVRTNPYANPSGEIRLETVNAQVGHFFDNPATRTPRLVDNIITISTNNTVVRFWPPGNGHVLEYQCYRSIRRDGVTDFLTDFSAALAFVYADLNVANAFYLADYEMRGRTHVFWFNYFVYYQGMAFPLPTERWSTATEPLPFPIEVTVDRGRVTRYRKVAYTFEVRG